ncbi:hypothetical protein GM658_22705 [Pseudoduganella eburnea]|uniref:Uncharacterized protein n=1 Tax=Massilia eburnea TaxID=1776165 RepID=A0A6L6QPI0_9BURK|nr:hypothetical protein [Massilia eburnea]MTW13423.1 hypothetical protein [Massilia eburnea]
MRERTEIELRASSHLFSDKELNKAISASLFKKLAEIHRAATEQFIPPENINRFVHGGRMVRPADDVYFDGGTRSISSVQTVEFKELVENDLSVLRRMLNSIASSVTSQFTANVFAVVGDASTSVGNVVDARAEGSTLAAHRRMWEKLEIQVSPDFTPKLPTMFVGPEAFDAFKRAAKEASPEQIAEIEQLKEMKIEKGRERERARQARFKRYGDSR